MDVQPREEGELPEPPNEADGGEGPTGSTADEGPTGPEARALALEAEEIRRLVEAGAGSPEAIRELAARLREHRAREEALWRAEVKPALVKEAKGRFRGHARPAPPPEAAPGRESAANLAWLGLLIVGLVLVVVIAANTTVWLLILPVVALLAWAWYHGREHTG